MAKEILRNKSKDYIRGYEYMEETINNFGRRDAEILLQTAEEDLYPNDFNKGIIDCFILILGRGD